MPEDHAAIQKDFNRLQKWADNNLIQFNKKLKDLIPGRNKPDQDWLGATQLESNFAERDLGVLVDAKLNTSQQYALAIKKVNGILIMIVIKESYPDQVKQAKKGDSSPLLRPLVRPHLQ